MLTTVLWVLGGFAVFYVLGIAVFERVVPRPVLRVFQRYWSIPSFKYTGGYLFGFGVIETIGRRTRQPRRTPVGGRLRGDTFWFIAANGRTTQYVKNIEANPRVRVQVHGRWRTGTAHLLPDDNVRRRLLRLNPVNSLFIWIAGRALLTVRIDLEPTQAR